MSCIAAFLFTVDRPLRFTSQLWQKSGFDIFTCKAWNQIINAPLQNVYRSFAANYGFTVAETDLVAIEDEFPASCITLMAILAPGTNARSSVFKIWKNSRRLRLEFQKTIKALAQTASNFAVGTNTWFSTGQTKIEKIMSTVVRLKTIFFLV